MRAPLLLFGFLIFGCLYIVVGIGVYQGRFRRAFIYPTYYSGVVNYAGIPFGIMSIIWAFAFGLIIPDSLGIFLTVISLVFGAVALLFNVIQPKFLTPEWVVWLRENHDEIWPYLHQDILDMGYSRWMDKTRTQEGLERWVTEVRAKHNL